MHAAGIASNLGAVRTPGSQNWRAPCPLGCGYSITLRDGEGERLLIHCHGGCSFDAVQAALAGYGLFDGDGGDFDVSPSVIGVRPPDDRERIAYAQEIYSSGVDDERISLYLRGRGISRAPSVLKFCEQAPHRTGIRLPAMAAPVTNVAGEQTGVHLTYLGVHKDGSVAKADLPRDLQRQCNGVIKGGAIRLMAHDPGVDLIVGEGIESSLSASTIFDLPCWAAGSAGGLKAVELPSEVRRVLVAADRDASGAGQRNAVIAYDRFRAEGRQVDIVAPPDTGDFNDVLMRRVNVEH
jgi:hypothetical protein